MIIMTPAKRLSPTTHPTERSRRAGGDDEKLLSGFACECAAISVPPRRYGFLRRVLCPGENRRAVRARFPHPPGVRVAVAVRGLDGRSHRPPAVTDPGQGAPSMGRAWKHTDGGNPVEDIG